MSNVRKTIVIAFENGICARRHCMFVKSVINTRTMSSVHTIADIAFAAACMMKLLPVLTVPIWLCIWISFIALMKAANVAAGYIRQKKFIAVHSVINKVTGGLLFGLPLTLTFIDLKYSAAVVCTAATAAAIQERYLIDRKHMN